MQDNIGRESSKITVCFLCSPDRLYCKENKKYKNGCCKYVRKKRIEKFMICQMCIHSDNIDRVSDDFMVNGNEEGNFDNVKTCGYLSVALGYR